MTNRLELNWTTANGTEIHGVFYRYASGRSVATIKLNGKTVAEGRFALGQHQGQNCLRVDRTNVALSDDALAQVTGLLTSWAELDAAENARRAAVSKSMDKADAMTAAVNRMLRTGR